MDPITRQEVFLSAAAGEGTEMPEPITREEIYLKKIAESGGGGGGGASSYTALSNKPKVNGVELVGNKTSAQLGLEGTLTWDEVPTPSSSHPVKSKGIYTSLAGKVDKEAGKGLSEANFTAEEKTKLGTVSSGANANIIEEIYLNGVKVNPVNKAVSLAVITRTVNNLQNYYLKTETYTQEEVNALINSITALNFDIVEELPDHDISTTTIYLVETETANVYMQYMYINDEWAQLGTTQVDLSNYYTKAQVDAALLLKQDALTFDSTPTTGSDNPVTSGGIKTALDGKQDTLTFDSAPTASSTNPVTSGGVKTALDGKQDELEFDTEPTIGSHKMVDSGAVATALSNINVDVATTDDAGIVKPDGTTITVDNDGTIHGSSGIDPNEDDFDFTEGVLSLQTNRRIWTGTQAEWDELSTAQKQEFAGGVANFTDDESAVNFDIYSTTETKTNKVWIDGKPIYRKVIHYAGVATSGTSTLIGSITGFADIISIEGTLRNSTDDNCFPLGYTYSNFGSTVIQNMPFVIGNNGSVYANPYGFNISNINVTIEYTKTTD